jgi:hypothetical protein
MASRGLAALQSRPTEFLDCPSLTLDELPQLVPPFEPAFQRIFPTHSGERRTISEGYLNSYSIM